MSLRREGFFWNFRIRRISLGIRGTCLVIESKLFGILYGWVKEEEYD